MAYPDFLGIGAQKAGTTWLSHNLQLHPGIWMPRIKELHYFNKRIDEPSGVRMLLGRDAGSRRWRERVGRRMRRQLKRFSPQDGLWDLRYYLGKPGDGWYASLFEPGGGKVTGEITPAYSTLDERTVARVHDLMPEAKIIFFMRNPVERAWSQAVMHFGRSGGRKIEAVPADRVRRHFEREGSRSRTDYLRTLEIWGGLYPEDQIFIGFLEDVHFFPAELLRGVYGFLGVDPAFEPPGVDERVHVRSTGRAPTDSMTYLARFYGEEIERLHERFGGYASFWLYCAECLISDPPASEDGQIPYPLWESSLWEEWARGENTPRLGSGTLASVGVAAGDR